MEIDLVKGIDDLNIIDELPQVHQDFIKKFSNIFNIDGEPINITTYYVNNEPYFKGKDVLKHLGYSIEKSRIADKFKEIKEINKFFCIILNKILQKTKVLFKTEPHLTQEIQENLKEYFFSKPGLYYLVGKSRKKEAENFKIFIYTELLPKVEQDIKDELLLIIKSKENKVLTLENKLDKIVLQNNKLCDQNNLILDLAHKQGIKLDHINQKLDHEILPNRNLPPEKISLQHKIILVQDIVNKKYKFIRGQNKYIETFLKDKKYILIFGDDFPNPIDLKNRFKEISKNNDLCLIEDIKNLLIEEDGVICKDKLNDLYEENKGFQINNNELILNNDKIEDIKNIYKKLKEKQFEK